MGSTIAAWSDRPLKDADSSGLELVSSLTSALLAELGLCRFSRLLDVIADNEASNSVARID